MYFFLLYDFLKCTATEFKSVSNYLDISLQCPTFVASIAAKFILYTTQSIEVKKIIPFLSIMRCQKNVHYPISTRFFFMVMFKKFIIFFNSPTPLL